MSRSTAGRSRWRGPTDCAGSSPSHGCATTARAPSAGTPAAGSDCWSRPPFRSTSIRQSSASSTTACSSRGRRTGMPARMRAAGCGAPRAPRGRRARGCGMRDIAGELPLAEHTAVVSDPEQLRRWLESVDGLGFGVLVGVPIESGEVARVAELFGHVRVTNYGRVFDVRSVVEPGESRLHPARPRPAHRQPLPRPGAVAAVAALPVLERARRREHARRRLLRGGGAARRRPGRLRAARRPLRDLRLPRRGLPS